ncbi:MAG: RluA family pseudouridine synthase [Clostridiales bacterium]|nr:RluA family pseudouridine synthase [Clostridiales bacterium]
MLEVLYEDNDIIVCVKPVGTLSQKSQQGDENNMCDIISEYLKSKGENDYVAPLHRLDRAVGGVMAFAKNQKSASVLSADIQNHKFKKEYLAIVHNCPSEKEGVLEDLLFKDSSKNKSFVVKRMRKGVKKASLNYKVLATENSKYGELSLVHIKLNTGRTHQIRVQFSSRKMCLLGDGKYGAKDNCDIALWSYSLCFNQPRTKEKIEVKKLPELTKGWEIFKGVLNED